MNMYIICIMKLTLISFHLSLMHLMIAIKNTEVHSVHAPALLLLNCFLGRRNGDVGEMKGRTYGCKCVLLALTLRHYSSNGLLLVTLIHCSVVCICWPQMVSDIKSSDMIFFIFNGFSVKVWSFFWNKWNLMALRSVL